MVGETCLYISNIEEILSRKNTGPVIKRIELEILADCFYSQSSSDTNSDFLKFTSRYSLAVETLERQINN